MARQTAHTEEDLAAVLLEGGVSSIYLPDDAEGIAAWEGLLFPATYDFYSGAAPEEILQRLGRRDRDPYGEDRLVVRPPQRVYRSTRLW